MTGEEGGGGGGETSLGVRAAASLPPAEGSGRRSGGGDLSLGSLIAILTVDGMVHVRSPSCVAVALTSIEVGTRPNDFFTLSPLPLPSSSSSSSSTGRRTIVATSYGDELWLIVVEDRESSQDFADRLMRLCIDASPAWNRPRLRGPHSRRRRTRAVAEASGRSRRCLRRRRRSCTIITGACC